MTACLQEGGLSLSQRRGTLRHGVPHSASQTPLTFKTITALCKQALITFAGGAPVLPWRRRRRLESF